MEKNERIGTKILNAVMGGISSMLPCVVAGGILMGIGFMLDDPTIDLANYGNNTPLASLFSTIGGTIFGFMLPILAAGIAKQIAGNAAIPAGLMAGQAIKEGTSGFLGALVVGLMAGIIVLYLEKMLAKLPETLAGVKNLLLVPLISVLIIGVATLYLVEPVIGELNLSLTQLLESMNGSSQILLGIILALMQAVDMGGPVNKTAYLFATAALANGQYVIMSAVLAGGIVPPYVTALASTLFKSKFTTAERASGLTNYVVGLAGITESAIPFLVGDPLRVILSCVVGSGIAGGLSVYFGCSVMAPFGGIFILPLNANPLGFVISILTGILVGTLILGFSKKPVMVTPLQPSEID